MALRKKMVTILLLGSVGAVGSGLYYITSLLGEITHLKGYKQSAERLLNKNRTLESKLKKSRGDLDMERKRLAATEKRLDSTKKDLDKANHRLAKIEADKPKGIRKIARGASKIPIVGSIASVGLMAADAAQAAEECYKDPDKCKNDASVFYEESRESAGKGAESANAWISEQVEDVKSYFSDDAGAR